MKLLKKIQEGLIPSFIKITAITGLTIAGLGMAASRFAALADYTLLPYRTVYVNASFSAY